MKQLLILLCFGLLLACNQHSGTSSESQTQDSLNSETGGSDTIPYQKKSFYRGLPNCPQDSCPVYVKAEYPYFKEKKFRIFIRNLMTPTPYNDKIAASLEIAADSFINEYKSFHEEYPESPAGYAWEQSVLVHQKLDSVVSFEHNTYSYTGGAHGMYSTLYYNIKKRSAKKLRLSDILVKGYEEELTKIAENIFRKENKLEKEENLGNEYFFENDQFYLNDNFLLTGQGIKFLYNPYEIAAYARGQVELFVPYTEIKTLIRKKGLISQMIATSN